MYFQELKKLCEETIKIIDAMEKKNGKKDNEYMLPVITHINYSKDRFCYLGSEGECWKVFVDVIDYQGNSYSGYFFTRDREYEVGDVLKERHFDAMMAS